MYKTSTTVSESGDNIETAQVESFYKKSNLPDLYSGAPRNVENYTNEGYIKETAEVRSNCETSDLPDVYIGAPNAIVSDLPDVPKETPEKNLPPKNKPKSYQELKKSINAFLIRRRVCIAIIITLMVLIVSVVVPTVLVRAKIAKRKDPKKGETPYIISTVTGNNLFGGTDANVYIRLRGKLRTSDDLLLTGSSTNPFERGDRDVFQFTILNLGQLQHISIWHDGTGKHPKWKLNYIEIDDKYFNKKYRVNSNTWVTGGVKTYFF